MAVGTVPTIHYFFVLTIGIFILLSIAENMAKMKIKAAITLTKILNMQNLKKMKNSMMKQILIIFLSFFIILGCRAKKLETINFLKIYRYLKVFKRKKKSEIEEKQTSFLSG